MWPFKPKPLREKTPDAERMRLIDATAEDCAKYLGIRFDKHSPKEIVGKIDEAIVGLVFEEPSRLPHVEDADILFGALWGTQIVREFDWQWIDIYRGKVMDSAVATPNREMVIYPYTFAKRCITKQCICTIELSFNMLKKRKGEVIGEPMSYDDIMESITHIVPPYELKRIS